MATSPSSTDAKKGKHYRAAHASFNKPYKLLYQTATKAQRKALLEANDAYVELRRTGYKEAWWHHAARELKGD